MEDRSITRSRASFFNPNTNHHSNPNHHFNPSTAAGSAQALVPVLLEQVPTFADEDRLSLELDSKETPKEHVKISHLGSRLPFSLGAGTLSLG